MKPRRGNSLPCPVCGGTERKIRYRAVPDYITDELFDLTLCRSCGLGITEPMPDDAQIGQYYFASYRGDRHAFTDHLRILLRSRQLARRFPPGFRGRLLDIGCGDGSFALYQKKLGWQVAVTEIHEPTLQRLQQLGVEAHTPQDAISGAIKAPFDAVTCWHVLEHAIRPNDLASWVHSLLNEQGIFQVSVPCLTSWQSRVTTRHWLHLDMPRHRYHFDDHTLRRLLTDAGFSVIHWSSIVVEYDWFGAIQSPLNAICSRPNVLFEMMTSRVPMSKRSPRIDRLLSWLLAPPIGAVMLPVCLVAELFTAGATLDVMCRPQSQPPLSSGPTL